MSAAIQFTGCPKPENSPVDDDEVSLSHDGSGSVLQGWRDALDEIEKTVAAGCDMSAVLDVMRGPILLGGGVVAFVEQRVESFEYKRFILRFNRRIHCCPFNICV